MIEKAKEYCPARLDPQNTTVWFNKVFAACSQIPEVKGGQIADVMWSAMPEDQAAIWLPEVQTQSWKCANPEAVLQTMVEQFVGADSAGSNAIHQYLEFCPLKHESYTAAWHRFAKTYTQYFAKTTLPAQQLEFSQVCNQFVLNWPDNNKKAQILDVLTRYPLLNGKPLMSVIARFHPLEMEARYTNNQSGAARQPSVAASADTEVPMSIEEIKETHACFQCQKPGHLKRNCPDANRNPPPRGGGARGRGGRGGRGSGSRRSIECHRCYRAGHMAKECQASNAEANQARAARAARTANQTSVNELASRRKYSQRGGSQPGACDRTQPIRTSLDERRAELYKRASWNLYPIGRGTR